MREIISFNKDWFFLQSDPEKAETLQYDHSSWKKIDLPHDWSIGLNYDPALPGQIGYLPAGIGWYRKVFNISTSQLEKNIYLSFDGIFMNSKIWINGNLAGERPYGYIGFGFDINAFLVPGPNLIAVRVDNKEQPSSRWYNGSGIYRNTWLTITSGVRVAPGGIFIRTPEVRQNSAKIVCELTLINPGNEAGLKVLGVIRDPFGNIAARAETALAAGTIALNEEFSVKNPLLWSPETPKLYSFTAEIKSGETTLDTCSIRFGVRSFEFVPNKGFFLNGKNYKFKGVCLHHDLGVVGAAVSRRIIEKRLKLLKEMGCNAIRTAHNPFSPEFYDLCDRLGFFVMDEFCDGWYTAKAGRDYGNFFAEWWRKDAEDFVRRDRNHPSVIMWSIGNEVREKDHQKMLEQTRAFLDLFHSLDPTLPVTEGVQGAYDESDAYRALLDVAGYNDGGGACFAYERDHERRPDQLMVATEAPHSVQTRGAYRTQTWWRDRNTPRMEIPNLTKEEIFIHEKKEYSSSYDNSGVRVGVRDSWSIAEQLPYLCGEFRWTGIDYYGECKWPSRKSESGVIDTANFPKDHYYLYQSMWRDSAEYPMVHLLPHWTHRDLKPHTVVPVWVYTNCEEAELFLNGRSLGRQKKGGVKNLSWDVGYEEGELEAAAYLNEKEVCRKKFTAAANPVNISISSDYAESDVQAGDTVQIDAALCDQNNTMVPWADNTIHFCAEGAVFVGTENGDALDLTPVSSPVRKAFRGLCAATVRIIAAPAKPKIIAASILGDKIFEDRAEAAISVSEIILGSGSAGKLACEIFYTLDGSEPGKESKPYEGTFAINSSTVIKAAVYRGAELLFRLEEFFIRGERQVYIDTAHTNKCFLTGAPKGPFADTIAGLWNDGAFSYSFRKDGSFVRLLGKDRGQPLGYWWYDDAARSGEIWFFTGEREPISLGSSGTNELIIDNSQKAFSTAYGFNAFVSFNRG
ncbi:MAG: DUF4982 domain-containing protein [Treponema sp.]|nr:DUF4982 domain-containing protein [Treponema sp.]